jgi:hypothetical protein
MKNTWCSILFAMAITICLSSLTYSQDITGSIVGTVKDTAGGAVSGATVTATIPSQGNKVVRTVTTTDDGTFSIPNVPVNVYAISVEAPNFKKFVQTDVKVDVGQRRPVDVILTAGNIAETVTVQADTVAVESSTPTASTTITGDQTRELAVNNRNWVQFVTLAPGVTNNLADQVPIGSFSPDGSPAIIGISVNGSRQSQNTFTVDGADITDRGSNITLQAFPSLDSIGELKVLRALYPAESGQSGGGQVNIVTRSGTEKFHGSFYEFVRNEKFNANNFITNRNRTFGVDSNGKAKRSPFRYNDYGFTVGGPVWFLNFGEHDPGDSIFAPIRKTYFFFSEEQRKDRRYLNLSGLVPTAGMRNGVFSVPVCLSAVQTTGPVTRTCNLVLPAGQNISSLVAINPTAQQYLTQIFQREPLPNNGTFGVFAPGVSTFDFQQEVIKIDTSFTSKWLAYYRYERDKNPSLAPNSVFGTPCNVPDVCTADSDAPGRTHTFDTTYSITPNMILEGRYTYAYGAITVRTAGLVGSDQTTITVAKPYLVDDDRVPAVSLSGLSSLTAFGPYNNFSDKHNYQANLTWVKGNHTMKYGISFSKYRKNEDNGLGGTGQGSFSGFFNTTAGSPVRSTVCVNPNGSGGYTAVACASGQQTTEQVFANFLLGSNVTFTQTKYRLTADFRQRNLEWYAQDEWRLRRDLTLYLGVRYSFFGAPWAANGLLTNFVPELYDPSQAPDITIVGSTSTRIFEPGVNYCNGIIINTQNFQTGPDSYHCNPIPSPYGKYIYHSPKKNFAPRFGLAWDIGAKGKTVLRTGYGIYHEQTLVGNIETHLGSNPPFQETITISGGSLSQPVPTGVNPTVSASDAVPSIIRGVDLDYKTPYMQHWSLDVQHLFSPNTIVTVGYYGSKGTHLIGVADINLLRPGYALTQTCILNGSGAMGDCQGTDEDGNPIPFTNSNPETQLDQIRPYRGYRAISMVQPRYNSNYHSLQVSATQRFGGASQVQLAYTWSKNLTDNQSDRSNSPQDIYDIRSEYSRAFLDRRHVLTVNYIYELPWYKNQQGFVGKVLGGWQTSGIVTYQTGLPFTVISSGFDPAGIGFFGSSPTSGRAFITCDPNANAQHTFEHYYDTSCFFPTTTIPTTNPAVPGTAQRGIVNGPPTFRIDFALMKNFRFGERFRLQLRGEAFNLTNHTNFSGLGTTSTTTSSFGVVTAVRDPRTLQFGAKFEW